MRWKPVLLTLVPLAAAAAVVALLWGGESQGSTGDEAAGHVGAGEREAGTLQGSGGAALAPGVTGRRTPHGERTEEEETPSKPAFPASEGIAGRVVDARKKPIVGASVTLHAFPLEAQWYGLPDEAPAAEAKSGKDGTFLVGPAPSGRLKVRAVAPGFAPTVMSLPQRGARVELVLDVGGALDVKVVDAKGAPVEGASVQHVVQNAQTQVNTVATTDKTGLARFDALPTGSGYLVITKAGLGAVRQQDVGISPKGKTELTVVLQGGHELTGLVTNAEDQRPVAGVAIEVQYPYNPGLKSPAAVQTNDEGRYHTVIDVGTNEMFLMVARHADFAEQRLWLNFNDSGTGSMQQDVKLGKGSGGYSGRVLTREGGPAAGASVGYASSGMPGQTSPSATTDAQGRFELAAPVWAPPGMQLMLIASLGSDGVGSVYASLPQRNEARGKAVEIRLTGSGSIAGTVKDGSGQPAEGAAVSIWMDWGAMQKAQGQGRPMDWTLLQALSDPKVSSRLTAVTDAEGKFSIPGVPAAVYQLQAQWNGLQATHEEPVDVHAGDTARVELVLGEGITIEGVVLDGDDRPVAGAMIQAQPSDRRPGGGYRMNPYGRSQSDGRFTLQNVGSGNYMVSARAAGYGSDVQRNVTAGMHDVTFHLKALGWIEGQVLLNSEPLAGTFTVSAVRKVDPRSGDGVPRPAGMSYSEGGGNRSMLFNSPDGHFALRDLVGGDYTVTATTPEGLVMLDSVAVAVQDGRAAGPVRLNLQKGSVLVGEVEGADGRPLVGAWLWVYPPKAEDGRVSPSGSARTDDKGAFYVRGLGAGAYNVNVNTDNGAQWTEHIELQAGDEKRVRFTERLPGRVRFTVVDARGSPLAKAMGTLTDANGNQVWPNWSLLRRDGIIDGQTQESWQRATTTDAAGGLTRYHVPPGRYRASATLQGYTPPADAPWIDVASSSVTDVTVTLTAETGK